jgi:TetR/AcrR family transcriptional repressor of acrEF/envCD operon
VTRGAIYWHFTSKSEIFNAIWEHQLPLRDIIHDRLSLSDSDDPLLKLREQFITRCSILPMNPGNVRFYKFCIISVNLAVI